MTRSSRLKICILLLMLLGLTAYVHAIGLFGFIEKVRNEQALSGSGYLPPTGRAYSPLPRLFNPNPTMGTLERGLSMNPMPSTYSSRSSHVNYDDLPLLLDTGFTRNRAGMATLPPDPNLGQGGMKVQKVPYFCGVPTIKSTKSGNWNDIGTWNLNRLPALDDEVSIEPGHTVLYNQVSDTRLKCIKISEGGAKLQFKLDQNTKVRLGSLLVLGDLEIGTSQAPIQNGVSAEILFDGQIDTNTDPQQFGVGLIGFGRISLYGAAKNPSFVRLAQEPKAGDTTLSLEQAISGWNAGDRMILPDSRHLHWGTDVNINFDRVNPQWETPSIASVSPDGRTITLTAPLSYNHPGARDGNGVLVFKPHVGVLTRNIVLRSANPTGTRFHSIFTYRADVNVQSVLFQDCGRTTVQPLDSATFDANDRPTHIGTNQIGRYCLHFHHLMGPVRTEAQKNDPNVYQFQIVNSALDHGERWGIAVHNSHYGKVQDNVVHDIDGAGIVAEDGTESMNVIQSNFVVRNDGVPGSAGARLGAAGRSKDDLGQEGGGIWLRGPNNYVRNNVVANQRREGYGLSFASANNLVFPLFKGADKMLAGQGIKKNLPGFSEGFDPPSELNPPLLDFSNNEAYGERRGYELWHTTHFVTNTIKDLKVWHTYELGLTGTYTDQLVLDGVTIINDKNVVAQKPFLNFPGGLKLQTTGLALFGGYNHNLDVKNARIHNMHIGLTQSSRNSVWSNLDLKNYVNIQFASGNSGTSFSRRPMTVTVTNADLQTPNYPAYPKTTPYAVKADGTLPQWINDVFVWTMPKVYRFFQTKINGQAPTDFQVYYKEQRADFLIPNRTSAKVPIDTRLGMTNQQAWNEYKLAIAGAVAPCNTTRPEIDGIVCSPPVNPLPTFAMVREETATEAAFKPRYQVGLTYNTPLNQTVPVARTKTKGVVEEITPVILQQGYNYLKRTVRSADGQIISTTFPILLTPCNDKDGDGYNAEGEACGAKDCNDNDATINKDAEEICGNGIDEDCNGKDLPCV